MSAIDDKKVSLDVYEVKQSVTDGPDGDSETTLYELDFESAVKDMTDMTPKDDCGRLSINIEQKTYSMSARDFIGLFETVVDSAPEPTEPEPEPEPEPVEPVESAEPENFDESDEDIDEDIDEAIDAAINDDGVEIEDDEDVPIDDLFNDGDEFAPVPATPSKRGHKPAHTSGKITINSIED